jgi:hypothetical protein
MDAIEVAECGTQIRGRRDTADPGYVGFRSQPPRKDRLFDHLGKLFLLDGTRTPQAARR